MVKKHLSIQKLGYIEPSITEVEVKVEAGFAETNVSLDYLPEESADDTF